MRVVGHGLWVRDPECPFIVSWKGHGSTEVKTAWKRARERADMPELLVHDLRRTAVRNMIRAGISEKRAMLISGHKTSNIFKRYDITDERDIQADGERLARYLEEKTQRLAKLSTGEGAKERLGSIESYRFNKLTWCARTDSNCRPSGS
jgi:integrase